MQTITQPVGGVVGVIPIEERVLGWLVEHHQERIRLRRGEVCDAMRAFGVIRKDEEFDKIVLAGSMSAMPPVNGERRKSYHRDGVLRFIVGCCREES
jgi:hypothetical protein